jgi:hypothetical protein
MLQVIFQETSKSAKEKSEILRKKFDIEVTSEMEEELITMCNLSEGIYERGMASGAEAKTIEMITNLWKKGMSIEFIKDVTSWTEEQIMKAYAMRIDASYEMFFRYISISQLINRVEKWIGREIIFLNNATAFGDVKACQKAAYYRDYINMRIEYGYDMKRSTSLYPRDLSEAHRAMVLAANRKDNEAKAAEREKAYPEFKKRFRSLKARYGYKAGDLMIRPAKTILEVMEEGQLLHHCVGASDTYIGRHARGESAILFLRYVSDPNTPYITVEIKDEKILQWYGRNDTKPDKEVIEKWLSAWIEAITERKKEAAKGAALVADQNILQAAV